MMEILARYHGDIKNWFAKFTFVLQIINLNQISDPDNTQWLQLGNLTGRNCPCEPCVLEIYDTFLNTMKVAKYK